MRPRLIAFLLALASVALLVSGCGDDGGDDGGTSTASADLARFAPADSLAFGQVAVRPEGSLSDSVNGILDRFPAGDRAGDELIKSLDESLADDELTYEDNVEPWLGQHVGGFITGLSFSGGEPKVSDDQAAIILETTDEDRAREELVAASEADGKVTTESYKGVELADQTTGKDRGTIAVFDGVAVIGGGPAAVRTAIDASAGDSLDANTGLTDFLAERQGDTLGVAYADVPGVFDALQRSGAFHKEQLDSIRNTYGSAVDQPFLAALDVESSQVSLDFAAGASKSGGISPEESSLVQSLPDDAWAVLGLGSIGKYVDQVTQQLGSLGAQGFSAEQLDRILLQQAGFSLDDLSVLGDAAIFAAGESILELQVGAVFEAPPGAARDRLLTAMRRAALRSGQVQLRPLGVEDAEGFSLASDFPAPINFAARGDKLVIAVGDTATETLLEGGGSSEAVDAARSALGGGDFAVTFALQMKPVLDLVDNSGGGDDPDFAEARQYLDQISTIAAGSRTEGDQTLFRIVAELTD